MNYSTFIRSNHSALQEPMFFGRNVNISRYDQHRYEYFDKLTQKQLSFFWRPEEIDISQDRKQFLELPEHEKHIFLSNLKYQTLLDSVQGRSPNVAFLPVVSIPELETWIETWAFSETIHSRSYTHIMRNLFNDPSEVFDDILNNEQIIQRATKVTEHYDKFIAMVNCYNIKSEGEIVLGGERIAVTNRSLKEQLFMTMVSVNVLEAIRFYVSFACSFAFAENGLMEGNAKIIRLIARDEALHCAGTQHIINLWLQNENDDPEMYEIAHSMQEEVYNCFQETAEQEKAWAKYLFTDGSMLGLNATMLSEYVEFITNVRLRAIGMRSIFAQKENPFPWINSWLNSDAVQVAPQETEITSYLVGQINNDLRPDQFNDFSLQ